MKTTFGIIFSLIITDNSYSISMKTWTRKKKNGLHKYKDNFWHYLIDVSYGR